MNVVRKPSFVPGAFKILSALGAVMLAAAGTPAAQTAQPVVAPTPIPVANAGFEEGEPGAPPPGWGSNIARTGADASAYRASIDAAGPRSGRSAVRLESIAGAASDARPFAALSQQIDATPYRGRRIRLTAAVRTDAAQAGIVGLWLRVDRTGQRRGFFDNMGDRPIRSAEWADYAIEGDVAGDTERINLGLLLSGSGRAWMDDVRLEDIGPASAATSPVTAAENLEAAIALLRTHHINSASADWDRIAAEARRRNAAATDARDAYESIQYLIDALGERHTMLRMQPAWTRPGAAPRESLPLPASELIDGRFGLLRLPAFMGSPEEAERYQTVLRDAVAGLDRSGVCGWILDLRENRGGNMWPMLNGLDPLLGNGPFGSFRSPAGRLSHWVRTDRAIVPAEAPSQRPSRIALRSADAPVAVLLGPSTASSGEMVAIALAGRSNVRSFGAPTAGFSTANRTFPLPDGAWLVITTSYARDRTGREYAGAMQPDEPVAPGEAKAAARRWLASRPCPR